MRQGNVSFILIVIRLFKTSTIKVAPRVEKTEVVKKGWNFSNRTYFTRCMMKKHCSLIYAKGAVFSPYFYLKIIFYSAKQFDCVVNFKYKLNIFFIFKYKHKLNIKGVIFELRRSHLFRNQPYKEVFEVNCEGCNFPGILSFTGVFEDFGRIFPTCFYRTSHNLICNKSAILQNKRLT